MADGKKNMFSAFLDLTCRRCLVVGGGAVAGRKVGSLTEAGADVTVVAPEAGDKVREAAEKGILKWEKRAYKNGEASEYALVVAATSVRELNEQVSRDAIAAGRLINVVDVPALCNFIVPSTLKRGDLQIAFSTSGACPALAKKLRRDLEEMFPESYARLLDALREYRLRLIAEVGTESERKLALEKVVNSEEMKMFLNGNESPLMEILKS